MGVVSEHKWKPGWVVLVGALLLVNVYLFFIRGLPALNNPVSEEHKPQAASTLAPAVPALAETLETGRFASSLGEMGGVAGLRSDITGTNAPGAHRSALRFDLEEAQGVPGQRTVEQWCQRIEGSVGSGENFSTALIRRGIAGSQVSELVAALQKVFDFKHCHSGDKFLLLRSPDGKAERFTYWQSALLSYRVERSGQGLSSRKVEERAEVEVAPISIRIEGSLYNSLEAAGESAALVMLIVDIFAWDIDFYTDTRRGDAIRLMVEKNKLNGKFVRYGRILAAEYRGQVGVHRAFYYQVAKGDGGYFDEEGGSLRKAFLKSPLKFVRITSGFGMRVHPILGYSAMHAGIDFGAPEGTPVWAPADGWVEKAGFFGPNGNLVVLRHANGFETAFAHLSHIARGVRPGARVKQKQVIGLVGSTGQSTGAHLHYGMRRGGQNVNPLTQKFPPADPIPKGELPEYNKSVAQVKEQLLAIPLPLDHTAAAPTGGKGAG